jgi:hypothetical protein
MTLATALDELVSVPEDAYGDWDDVLRRAHLFGESERTLDKPPQHMPVDRRLSPRGRHGMLRGLRRKAILTVVLALLIAAVAAVVPGRIGHGRTTLIDRAIAAIGNGRMTHIVLDRPGTRLVDFRTGRTTLVQTRSEFWADPKLGTLGRMTLDGKLLLSIFIPPSPNGPKVDSLLPFLKGYRSKLRSGDYHAISNGRIGGQPVEWIAGKAVARDDATGTMHFAVQEIAISRATYKPLYMRIRIDGVVQPDSRVRVIAAETLQPRPSLFAHRHPFEEGFKITASAPATTLREARAAMNPDPIVPPSRLARLQRSWIGLPRYLAGPSNKLRQIGGVELFYGRTDFLGHPIYRGSFISITEFPHKNPAVTDQGIRLFPQDAAIVSDGTATMKTHGLYIIINAGSTSQALTAARALAH